MPHATRMSDADTGLLVIDVQEKLMPLIPNRAALVRDVGFPGGSPTEFQVRKLGLPPPPPPPP